MPEPSVARCSLSAQVCCRAVALVVMLTGVAGAAAKPPGHSAQERAALLLFGDAKRLFKHGRYEQARVNLERARLLVKQPVPQQMISYWLGRTYAALERCQDALPLLEALRGKLVGPLAVAERSRATTARRCRLSQARALMATHRCQEALSHLHAASMSTIKGAARREAIALRSRAKRCVRAFGTQDAAGQRAASLHALARAALAAQEYTRAAELADRSLKARPSALGAYVKGAALAQLGRCEEALGALARVRETSRDRDAATRAETGCLLALARRDVPAERCRAALPYLERLAGRLKGKAERWRAAKLTWCRPRATDFRTETATRKAAYELYLAGKQAQAKGHATEAAGLYRQALGISDEPAIRRRLGEALLAGGTCAAAARVWGAIPRAQRTAEDSAREAACGAYAPAEAVPDLGTHVGAVVRALLALRAGRFGQAADGLKGPVSAAQNGALAAIQADALFRAGRCPAFLRAMASAQALGGRVEQAAARRRRCEGTATAGVTAPTGSTRSGATTTVGAAVSPQSGATTTMGAAVNRRTQSSDARRTWGWVALGA